MLTLGVNWYLNPNFKVMMNYLLIDVDRLNPAGPGNLTPFGPRRRTPPPGVEIGQDLDVFALRTQYSFLRRSRRLHSRRLVVALQARRSARAGTRG